MMTATAAAATAAATASLPFFAHIAHERRLIESITHLRQRNCRKKNRELTAFYIQIEKCTANGSVPNHWSSATFFVAKSVQRYIHSVAHMLHASFALVISSFFSHSLFLFGIDAFRNPKDECKNSCYSLI